MKLRYTRRALADVVAIADYVVVHNPSAAADIEAAIASTIGLLTDFPLLGRSRPELDARALGVPRYPFTVYYRIDGDEIWIVHIRDDRRRELEPGGL
jgi:toxin ParE1/3/4